MFGWKCQFTGGCFLVAVMTTHANAQAQTWQPYIDDSGALYHGSVSAPLGTTGFRCTAPSPQGIALMNTGDHEANRTDDPCGMIITFSTELLSPYDEDSEQSGFRMILDNVAYSLPSVQYSDFYGEWTARPYSMTDPIFAALINAQEMIVDPGLGTAFSYPVDGLSEGVSAAIGHCISGWELAGHQTPAALAFWLLDAPLVPLPASGWTLGHVQELADAACDGLALFDLNGPILEDFDGDGQTDLVLDWGVITCPYADPSVRRGAGDCGAASCSIDFHMTTQSSVDGVLGLGAWVDMDRTGQRLIAIGGSLRECRQVSMESCYFRYDLSTGSRQWLGPVAQ